MARYIDADRARETATIDLVVHHLDRQPTVDAVEVVRCKDCKNCSHDKIFGHYWCNRMHSTYKVKPDDFCSYGKRKERDTNG